MNYVQNIVVVGKGVNTSKLHTRVEPIKLNKNIGMAVTSFAHGEIHNIHEGNNTIHFAMVARVPNISPSDNDIYVFGTSHKVQIPVGVYRNTESIIKEIRRSITAAFSELSDTINHNFGPSKNKKADKNPERNTYITTLGIILYVDGFTDTPWNLIGIFRDINPYTTRETQDADLCSGIELAFLYVNIVENSYINGEKTRNLSILPLQRQQGYSFYEFKNPVYIPVEVKQFSTILLEIRNINGEYVKFNPESSTVISLHLKPINREG